jgi:hypothetical protein
MTQQCNHNYYLDRAQTALRQAAQSRDKAIRKLHLTMATEYRARAAAAPPPGEAEPG